MQDPDVALFGGGVLLEDLEGVLALEPDVREEAALFASGALFPVLEHVAR